MPSVYWDIEGFSKRDLTQCGAHIYAADASTRVLLMSYAIDDGPIEVWKPGDPVPAPFANPAGYMFISDNWEFERAMLEHVLVPLHSDIDSLA